MVLIFFLFEGKQIDKLFRTEIQENRRKKEKKRVSLKALSLNNKKSNLGIFSKKDKEEIDMKNH